MGSALRTEWRKVTTTRTWWVLVLVMVLYVGLIAAFLAFATTAAAGPDGAGGPAGGAPAVLAVYTLAVPLGYVFPGLVGILAVTTEYRHRTITSTLLAETRRPLVVAAKALVALAVGAVVAVAGLVASTGAGAAVLSLAGEQTLLDQGETWATLARAALGLTVWAVIGVGFGLLLRNQVAAIVTLLAFSQLVEPILRIGLTLVEATRPVARFLPGAAGDALTGSSIFGLDAASLLEPWQGGLVLVAYAVVLGGLGAVGFVRRDVS